MRKMIPAMIGAFIVMAVLVSGFASAAINFTAEDSQDVADADFDIISGGAYPSGNYIVFWMQVRGQINLNPVENYSHGYSIDIYYHDTEIELAVVVYNYGGYYLKEASMTVNGDATSLTEGKDYVISGGKLSFYVDQNIGNIGSMENTDIEDVYFDAVKFSGAINYASDSMEWSPSSSSGGSTDTTYTSNSIGFLFLSGVLFFVCIGVWIIIWLLVALWAYKDAKKRGADSPILWFFVVLFLGLIGLIIYIIVRPKQEQSNMPPPPPPAPPP